MIATIKKAPIMAGLIRVENRIAKTQSKRLYASSHAQHLDRATFCYGMRNGVPLYEDSSHLSPAGSNLAG